MLLGHVFYCPVVFFFFFFSSRRRHTRCLSDWSSDVCSSDLLRPKRTHNGYRAYGEQDLVRLEQIVALKFVGLPLRRIKALLDRDGLELSGALHMQRRVLEAKRGLLDQAIEAIRQAE